MNKQTINEKTTNNQTNKQTNKQKFCHRLPLLVPDGLAVRGDTPVISEVVIDAAAPPLALPRPAPRPSPLAVRTGVAL
jgi:hypothetical protein